jgi:hypothetical protein
MHNTIALSTYRPSQDQLFDGDVATDRVFEVTVHLQDVEAGGWMELRLGSKFEGLR